ncbi:conserved hypothetical protein [Microsporum canis CBS 113480]|uniref:Uncharacterized protein n=1 Tax=Arthroderma otae (strain ATCC MYA-4605 / CBS 113480) TaxID=554155 RepID=C5FWI9_ARTOC|nr:conserved hypothetical protein [Microsporum canis CBS 113480]EEQ34273.1 conserved hypothetical protein [Microsporum canis CBS 113480]
MQFFHKNKSQPTLLNSVESAPHNDSDHSINSQNHHSHHSRDGSQQQLHHHHHQHQQQQQQQLYQQQHSVSPHPQHTFQPAAGSGELSSSTYQLGQHSTASYTHPAHAGSRSENFSLPLQASDPYPPAAGRPTLNLVPSGPSASLQPDHGIDALSAAPSLPSAPHSTEASPLTETQPRKSRRSFFSLHSKDKSSSQNPAKPSRNVSVRKKISNPIPHPKPYQVGPLPPSDPAPDPDEGDLAEKKLPQLPNNSSQPSLPQSIYPARGASRSSSHLDIQPFEPPQIQRVSTEPLGQHEEHYKGRTQQHSQYQAGPPPSHKPLTAESSVPDRPAPELKYNRVKRYYFDKEAQVQQLQNTVAHQRMSASRTVLDDNEYATRLGRLDGAINNLSFNIRKDWKNIPPWLQGVVNEDAHTVGTKEMTAVGRACLTRWIVDELFDRYFHPGLEPNLSRQLKQIERNVRRMGKFVTEEEQENHLSKVSSWRRTTLDGLGDIFQSKLADDHRALLTRNLVEKLTASLEMNLKTPPPPGLENGVAMIVELAVGISANIPLESRDISIDYFLPGATIAESHMKIETTLPPLSNPGMEPRLASEPSSAATDRVDQSSIKGIEAAISSSEIQGGDDKDPNFPIQPQPASQGRKKSVFGSLMGKKPHPGPGNPVDAMRPPSGHFREREEAIEAAREKENENRIRFAAFVSVEVRSKGAGNVIVKAPVYPFS